MPADGGARSLLAVDASPYVFRAHHALPSTIVDPSGRPAAAVYGFATFLLKLLADERPAHAAVAFDDSLTTSFRNRIYPPYKQHREAPPDALERQLPACRELVDALGISTFRRETLEADDLLGSLCEELAAGGRVTIVSSDKDLAQLVTADVDWYDAGRGRRYGPRAVRERFGVPPRQIPDLLALTGDAVDNIPGVPGIGPKTAVALLRHFDDVEQLLASVDRLADLDLRGAARLQRLLREHADGARLSRRLATVRRDASLGARWADLRLRPVDGERMSALCDRLGFDTLRQRLLSRPC